MAYDEALIAAKLRRWEKYLGEYRLPAWEEIPDFGLYMEQVIALLKTYLDYLPPELKEEQFITAATINNYVRRKLMPEPVKKRYYRIHIAYLIMICSLKQGLSTADLNILLPADLPEPALRDNYSRYVARHRLTSAYFAQQVRLAAAGILQHPAGSELAADSTEELIVSAAVVGGFAKLLAEKLLLLNECALADADPETLK